jgi:hypothetical protein
MARSIRATMGALTLGADQELAGAVGTRRAPGRGGSRGRCAEDAHSSDKSEDDAEHGRRE